jgi:integrase
MQDKAKPRREHVPRRRGIYYRLDVKGRRVPGTFEISFYDSLGVRRWQTITGSVEDAEAARAEVAGRKRRGERVVRSKQTLAEYVPVWLDGQAGRLRPKTITTYEGALRLHVVPRLGRLKLGEISTDDVAALVAAMRREGYKPWTIKGTVAALSGLLRHAARRGELSENPVGRLERGERPVTTEKEKRVLTGEEIGRLLDAADVKYRPLLAVAVGSGLRLGELLGLRWQDVDTDAGYLHVRTQVDQKGVRGVPKTPTAVRSVVLSPQLGRLLMAHREAAFERGFAKGSDPVFASERGTPLGHDNVRGRGLAVALHRAGLDDPERPNVTMHSLRDTFASHAIVELRLDVVQVSRLLGHANPAITAKTYARMFDEARHSDAIRAAMEASSLGTVMEPRPGTEAHSGALPGGVEGAKVVELSRIRT